MKDIYLDGAANTPLDHRVFAAMKPYLSENFCGNASATHDYGMKASMAVEDSRQKISDIVGVKSEGIIFTSGATESNNTAIKSLVFAQFAKGNHHPHIVCGGTEHSSVLNTCKEMELIGCEVSYIAPNKKGCVPIKDVCLAVKENTILICFMSVNNELGTVNRVKEVTEFARKHHVSTLIDCTQCVGYGGEYMKLGKIYPLADMMTFSAHKIYGPLGVGCLIINNDDCLKTIRDFPLLTGGSQEHGARGGTYNVPGIVGMAAAIELMAETPLSKYFEHLYNYMVKKITDLRLPIIVNAEPTHKNIVSLNISAVSHSNSAATTLTMLGVACSSGSACDAKHDETSGDFNPSHVLTGIGLSEDVIRGTIRVSFTKYTTEKDIDEFVDILYNM